MKVLVIGSGGREHALVWKIKGSPHVKQVFCAPGNAGIADEAVCVPIASDDIKNLLKFAKEQKIDLTIVGPEVPLTLGVTDIFIKEGLRIFGPTKIASEIEGSKIFAKEFCIRHGIPTAKSMAFDDVKNAKEYLRQQSMPLVIKADGLAAGKGVFICEGIDEAERVLNQILVGHIFGEAGKRIIIEEFLEGEEASFIAVSDGENVLPLASSQDHKRIFDGDRGPNTGGMGAYSPAPVVTSQLNKQVLDEIMVPTIRGMASEGRKFVGILYAGLMIKNGRPFVLEFNCRFGDPETQPIMMRLKSDLIEIIEAAIDGRLNKNIINWDIASAVCVVLSAKGYPGEYKKGDVIKGLSDLKDARNIKVFHSGTLRKEGDYITNGGRVLGVTALGNNISDAIKNAYGAVAKISWNGMHYRKDIGRKAL